MEEGEASFAIYLPDTWEATQIIGWPCLVRQDMGVWRENSDSGWWWWRFEKEAGR